MLPAIFTAFLCLALVQAAHAVSDQADTLSRNPPVALKTNIEIEDGFIRLGDIFENVGENADQIISRAPHPGKEITFSSHWVRRIAKSHDVKWDAANSLDSVSVFRTGHRLDEKVVRSQIRSEYVLSSGDDGPVELEFSGNILRMLLPTNIEPTLAISDFSLDKRSGRFTAHGVIPATGKAHKKIILTGRFNKLGNIPVPLRNLPRGHIIRKQDLQIVQVYSNQINRTTVSDPYMLIGKEARQSLMRGKMIRSSSIRTPILVHKNRRVLMAIKTPIMSLTAQGTALQDGSSDEVVQVRNAKSGIIVEAVVVGPGQVAIQLPGHYRQEKRMQMVNQNTHIRR